MTGEVVFIGAGPGAADLITVRGARVIAEVDIVIWASSLVDAAIVAGTKPGAVVIGSAAESRQDITPLYQRAQDDLLVARVHSGHPSIFGATAEQRRICDRIGIPHRTLSGVCAFSVAAACMGAEITIPEVLRTLILTRLEGGRTPMPERGTVRGVAAQGVTMALCVSGARNKVLQEELLVGGYPLETHQLSVATDVRA